MKIFKTIVLIFAWLCLSQQSQAQTLTFSKIEACPGETVTLMVSLENAPANFSTLDFRFIFDYNWGNVTVVNIETLTPGFGTTNYDLATNTFTYAGGYADGCSINLGSSFDVVAIDVKLPNSFIGCINTNTSYVILETSASTDVSNCDYTEVPTAVSDGSICAAENCDPCCAPPSLPLEFSIITQLSETELKLLVWMCLHPRSDCPDIEYLFRYRLETNPDWTEINGPSCYGALILDNIPGVPYIFEGAYLNPTCMTEWTTIEYVTPLLCDGEMTKIDGTVTTIHEDENCADTDGGIAGANVVVYNENGDVFCESTTEEDGAFVCEICEGTGTYKVCIETTCDKPCGLKASDLLRYRKHILGITPKTDLDIVVGDINEDGVLSNLDLICIQRYILGFDIGPDDPCYVKNWCRFIPKSAADDALNNPNYDNCITVDSDDPDALNVDFVRAMLGDMNGSCDDCTHGDDMGPLKIISEDHGGVLSIKSTEEVATDLFVLEIKLAASDFDVTKVSGVFQNIDFLQKDGLLKIVASNTEVDRQIYSTSDALLRIEGERRSQNLGSGQNGLLSLSDNADMNVFFDGQKAYTVSIGQQEGNGRSVKIQKDVSIDLNSSAQMLTIFSKENNKQIQLSVQNILGQQIHDDQFFVNQGMNTIPFNFNSSTAGIYVLTLFDGQGKILASEKFFKE